MPRIIALTASQLALLSKYSLVLVKDAPEAVRKDLRKARKLRRKLRMERKAAVTNAKAVSAAVDKAEGKPAPKKAAKQSRKIKNANKGANDDPKDPRIESHSTNGGTVTVTKLPEGARSMSKLEMAAATRGVTPEALQAERQLAAG